MQATQEKNLNNSSKDYPIPVITLWRKKSKKGKHYFTGQTQNKKAVIGFYNTNKSNPQEPDIRIHYVGPDYETADECCALWCNLSKTTNEKYLSGGLKFKESTEKITEEQTKVVGFINNNKDSKQPYLRIYLKSVLEARKSKKAGTEVKEVVVDEFAEDDLPF